MNGLLGVQVTHTNTGREYQATFDQSTTIGKIDELAERRAALLKLYATVAPAGARNATRPGGVGQPDAGQPGAGSPKFTIPAPVGAPAPGPEAVPAPVPTPVPTPVQASVPAPVPAQAPAAELDPADVPAEYRRMAKKAIRAARDGQAPPALIDALRAFMDAVGTGADEDTLDELADALEDAYDDSRR